ncbi:branched-chain amino acid ABC transporter, permease [Deferribacter desulfuricans SSM1]|uniref:Branched-chain amino acid ABC transporter, permease n=1 Tax=Deferribacter desulfuricans (strain DSM 14783 / JCM 11476 / NBRC 101012 / SSM1) TaxID=639282 RepID=D3PD61_DEFDS|nr:branched-chain amino acid ABC transporter permease [Deferribacter desulfuricans]BAI80534.1 branched-chain amino acid ABC transporter, permease [Deferribacter desulfuricans SSM1]
MEFLSFFQNDYFLQIATMTCINIVIVLGLNLITGVTGQLSLGHAAFMSLGAYCSALLALKLNMPFWVCVSAGTLFAGIMGALLGIPILRLRGDYLAIATLGFGEIVRVVILNTPIAGRALGLYAIPQYTTFFIALLAVILGIIFMYRFENSRHGLALRSIREDEIAAEMMGVDIAKYKILAFAVGSAFAGLGGSLYAHFLTYINPNDFGFMKSIEQLCMLVLGGMGSITGAAAGAVVLSTVPELLRFASEYRMVTYGVVLIVMMIFRPQGLFGKIRVNV